MILLLGLLKGIRQGIMIRAISSGQVSVYSIPTPYHSEQTAGQVRGISYALKQKHVLLYVLHICNC